MSCMWCAWCVVACRSAVCRVRAEWCVACGAVYDVLLSLFYYFHCCSCLLHALEKQTQM